MSDESKTKWDLKQIGTGAGSAVLALTLMQSQGIELMNRNQDSKNSIVIEKAVANASRIDRLELTVKTLTLK